MKQFRVLFLFSLMLISFGMEGQKAGLFTADDIDIPYTEYTLKNGLRLVVHQDDKAPIVAVNIWYHVGSKDERPGRTGFAHLFEHLMFNGSENFNTDYFQALESIGGTDLNGTTSTDRTNYFQNVPLAGLDQVLFLESDRMGHMLGAVDQARLDEQRGVVMNEKRQGENQPYGLQWDYVTKEMFPKGHPYSWSVIGEMEHIEAATLDDVYDWFKTYYGPSNAVLVIAGDVDPDDIHERVKRYFGHIPPGPALPRPELDIPVRLADTRMSYQDRVPETRINYVWNSAEWGSKDGTMLDLATDILSTGKNARLYKKLVYEDKTASSAGAFVWNKEIAGNLIVQVNLKPGVSATDMEASIDEVMNDFIENGPTQDELDRVKSQYFANFIKGIERIGGFGGKSDILAQSAVFGGNPDFYKTTLEMVENATVEDIKAACQRWLTQGKFTLTCKPLPDYSHTKPQVDRSLGLPELGEPVSAKFPDIERKTLSNGLEIVLAKREGVPTMVLDMIFDAGTAADQFGKPGTATLAMNMMDEGTKELSSLEISEKMQILGASISSYASLDASHVAMTTLKPSFDQSLDLYADVILNPAFPQSEFDRLKDEQLAAIAREKKNPIQMALRALPRFMYGEGHAYSLPMTGSGFDATVKAMTKEDVEDYYADWIKPNNAKLCVVGDISMDELVSKVEKHFKNWKKGKVPNKNISDSKDGSKRTIFLMDKPESAQTVILAGHLSEPYGAVPEVAKETMLDILGGQFTSRINMNLREDKHWSYGAGTFMPDAKGQRMLVAFAQVQGDKTKESIEEIVKEFEMISGDKPITQDEFDKTTQNTILQLPGSWETNAAVMGSLSEIVQYDLPDDYYKNYDQEVRNLTVEQVRELTNKMIKPKDIVYFLVGDQSKVIDKLKELDLEIIILDANGNPKI
ncbi:MAG: pitrilysin family protein [Bacteroidota bacterium]